MDTAKRNGQLSALTAEIVAAYAANNKISGPELASLIGDVHAALHRAPSAGVETPVEQEPAVSIRRSITSDYIICLEDGAKFKSLKRHIKSEHDLTPDQYRNKWDLPRDYPMVAPSYAQARSELANKMGLGKKAGTKVAGRAKRKRSSKSANKEK